MSLPHVLMPCRSEVTFPFGKNGQGFSMWDRDQCMAYISLKNSNPNNLFLGFDAQLRSICGMAQLSLIGQFIIAVSLLFQVSRVLAQGCIFLWHLC